MDLSARNKKVAIARWNNLLKEDTLKIKIDRISLIKKAALCGFLAGDGSVQVRKMKTFSKYQLDLFADDKLMLKTYNDYIFDIYKKKPKISRRDNMLVSRISRRYIVLDLLKECKFGIKKWTLPNELFKLEDTKEAWLKAFFSAEGYVGERVIKIQSININSIKKVNILLREFNIKGNYYEYSPKDKNNSKVGMIFINEKISRIIYYNKIGFWHERKSRKLKESLDL